MRDGEQRSRQFAKRLRQDMTEAERVLWSALRKRSLNGFKFRRQHPIGPYIADFACISERLVVEVDGVTHWTPAELEHDAQRSAFLERNGWRVLRVTNLDVFDNLDGVWLAIAQRLPPPAPQGAPASPASGGGNRSE